MRRQLVVAAVTGALLLSLSACAALKDEQRNGAQFASWQHMGYSLFRGTPKKTTASDLVASQTEKWWGEVIRVAPKT